MKRFLLIILSFFAVVSLLSAADEKKKEKSAKEYIADLSGNNEALILDACDWAGKEEEKDAIPQLKNLLKGDKRDTVRMRAAMALGYIAQEDTFNSLADQILVEPSADVRYTIVLSMTRIGMKDEKQVKALQKAKQSESDPFILDYIQKIEDKYKKK
jgi:HEAT repeat protein